MMRYHIRPLLPSVPGEVYPHRPIPAGGVVVIGEPSHYWLRMQLVGDVEIQPVPEIDEKPRRASK